MLYCGESNVAPSKYSIMDNKNHFESKVSDFLEAMRKAGYSESTIRQYKKTCRLFIVYMDIGKSSVSCPLKPSDSAPLC